jgi:hypothetical protein
MPTVPTLWLGIPTTVAAKNQTQTQEATLVVEVTLGGRGTVGASATQRAKVLKATMNCHKKPTCTKGVAFDRDILINKFRLTPMSAATQYIINTVYIL